jgi:hypothetical protein
MFSDTDTHIANGSSPQGPLDFIRSYIERGWFIFPAPPGGKLSYLSKDDNGNRWGATNDPAVAKQYFEDHPRAGIGIACGESGIFVVEADTIKGHGVDGLASLQQLQAQHGILPTTLMAQSPSGSVHYYFNKPTDLIVRNSTSALAPGIDVRGDGGMAIAPPTVRPGVGAYEWLNDNPIADAPTWLLDMVVDRVAERPFVDRSPDTIGPNAVLVPDLLLEIHPDSLERTEWLQVACAVFGELGDRQGREVFRQWTSRGIKYDADEDGRQ